MLISALLPLRMLKRSATFALVIFSSGLNGCGSELQSSPTLADLTSLGASGSTELVNMEITHLGPIIMLRCSGGRLVVDKDQKMVVCVNVLPVPL